MLRYFDKLEEWLMAVFLLIMTVMTFLQVVLRYVFDSGLVWSLEATTYSFGWLVLLGMSSGIRTNSHIAVDLVVGTLSPWLRMLAALGAVVFSLFYAGLMGYGGLIFVERLMDLGNFARDIALPRWLLMVILPIGFGLLGLRLVQASIDIIKGSRTTLGQQENVKEPILSESEG